MIPLKNNPNVDNGDLVNYPDGTIKNNDGTGNGTGVNRKVYGDLHSNISRMMRLYGITPNSLFDNETNGYQIIESIIALASKNDFILNITSAFGVLGVGVKIGKMLLNEQIVCKANVDWTAETQIKGSDNITYTFTKVGDFKANEYVRLIKNASTMTIVRLADSVSLDAMISDLSYLKKATQPQENAGAIDTKGTTPLSNLTAFVRRVIGADSSNYLALPTGANQRNGLLSFADKSKLDNLASKTRNIGTISSIEVGSGSIGATYAVSADVVSATIMQSVDRNQVIRVVVANTMTNNAYYVKSFLEGLSADIRLDNSVTNIVFKPISATSFDISMEDIAGETGSIKIHLEVVKI